MQVCDVCRIAELGITMTRASRNLCFLLAVTVINVLIYIAMSGNFFIFKNYTVQESSHDKKSRMADASMQDRMSKLVREALRDEKMNSRNLTQMLAKYVLRVSPHK